MARPDPKLGQNPYYFSLTIFSSSVGFDPGGRNFASQPPYAVL
jgi:hypothetical protein